MPVPSRLPDAEYEIMQIIWSQPAPITSAQVVVLAEPLKNWKPPTVLTLLRRLTNRGFLKSEKHGKDLYHTYVITKEEYIKAETEAFMDRFHKKSLRGLMRAMYSDKKPSAEDIAELEKWLKDEEREEHE